MDANTPSIATAAGDISVLNAAVKTRYLQNLGTNTLFVRLGTGASSTVFHFALAGGTANDDGRGGTLEIDTAEWAGIVSIAGTSPRYVLTNLT